MDQRKINWMIRQHFLNRLIPPAESHKILGSNFLYDLFQCHVYFSAKDRAQNTNIQNPKEHRKSLKECFLEGWNENNGNQAWQEWKDGWEKGRQRREYVLDDIINYEPSNIFVWLLVFPIQLVIKLIVGFLMLIVNCIRNKKQDD